MEDQQSLDFAEHARHVVEEASTAPWPLRDGRTVIPREVLAVLAEIAAAAPVTGQEIDYTQTLRESFDALAAKDHSGDPDLHVFGLMLALMSLDRGGYLSAANACDNALQYMASLPAWREVDITFGGSST